MKNRSIKKIIAGFAFVFISSISFAQMMGPQDPGSGPEANDPPVGGGASLSGGVILLLTLGAAYGGKKIYYLVKDDQTEERKDGRMEGWKSGREEQ